MIIGPAVSARKPKIHGTRNRYAAQVSLLPNPDSQRRALVTGPGADSIATLAKRLRERPLLLRLVDRSLRLALRLVQRSPRRLLAAEHAIDGVLHRLVVLRARRRGRLLEAVLLDVDEEPHGVVVRLAAERLVQVLEDLHVRDPVSREGAGERPAKAPLIVEADLDRLVPRTRRRHDARPRAGETLELRALRDRPRVALQVRDLAARLVAERDRRKLGLRRPCQNRVVPALLRPRTNLRLIDLILVAEKVPGLLERVEAVEPALVLDQLVRVRQRLDGLRMVEERPQAVLAQQVEAERLRPEREELGQLRIEPDPRDLPV